MIVLLDLIAAALVIYSLFCKFKYKRFWLIYALGCFIFIGINLYKGLAGQCLMNIVATVIAVRNYYK